MTRPLQASVFFALAITSACLATSGCGKVAKVVAKGAIEQVASDVADGGLSEQDIRQMFEQVNAACPRQTDQYTTLESVKMIDDRRVEYRYKVTREGKNILRRIDKEVLRKAAVDHTKGNAMAVAIAERDLTVEHVYEDAFGSHVLSYTINKQVLAGNYYPLGEEKGNPFATSTVKADPSQQVVVKTETAPSTGETQPSEQETPTAPEQTIPETVTEPEPKVEKPSLPTQYRSQQRSTVNPAGVQSNPFFD